MKSGIEGQVKGGEPVTGRIMEETRIMEEAEKIRKNCNNWYMYRDRELADGVFARLKAEFPDARLIRVAPYMLQYIAVTDEAGERLVEVLKSEIRESEFRAGCMQDALKSLGSAAGTEDYNTGNKREKARKPEDVLRDAGSFSGKVLLILLTVSISALMVYGIINGMLFLTGFCGKTPPERVLNVLIVIIGVSVIAGLLYVLADEIKRLTDC